MKFFVVVFVFFLFIPLCLFASLGEEYLVELGKTYLEQEKVKQAEAEFKKALVINPTNKQAKQYLRVIRSKKVDNALDLFSKAESLKEQKTLSYSQKPEIYPQKEVYSSQETEKPSKNKEFNESFDEEPEEASRLKVSGRIQASFGIDRGGEFVWKKANDSLNEESSRILSDSNLNRRENTFDPFIFSQLQLNADYPKEKGWGFHSKVDISPWSFIGKSDKVTVTAANGDTIDIELLYWSNTSHTMGQIVYTNLNGDSIALPELEVEGGRTEPVTITSLFGTTFDIPGLDIHRDFQPLRELWFDYNNEGVYFKIFPLATEAEALSSDDPLGLTNHHNSWEESEWLNEWAPGHTATMPWVNDFYKGWWDDSLAYATRDSTGARLTSLRGFSLALDSENASLDFTAASPKDLWQDYDEFGTWESALRGKHFIADSLTLGFLHAAKVADRDDSLDAYNHVLGLDLNIGLTANTEIFLEAATSRSKYDITFPDYTTEKRGNAFNVTLINSSEETFGKGYFDIHPAKSEDFNGETLEQPFYKLRLALTHMDEAFDSALANYRSTRDDAYWSRHLTFRKPFEYYSGGLFEQSFTWDDINMTRLGDGIDYGRDVIHFRVEAENLLDYRLDTLFDVRNVHSVDGKFIENVARLEATYQVTDKLTAKFLGIDHRAEHTLGGYDPYFLHGFYDEVYSNDSIDDGVDPSLRTVSLGVEYDFFDWLDMSFVWEHTNDAIYAYDNFPRGLLTGTGFWAYYEYGEKYRRESYWLNNNDAFPLPPYPYFDIFKVGINLQPRDDLHIYLDYTRNEFEWAQLIDDNMNHIGIEAAYTPFKKLGFYVRYVYSRVKDITELNEQNSVSKDTHHSVFSEIRYNLEENSELVAQYGVGNISGLSYSSYTPFGGGVATLDTEHIFRLTYRKKF